MAKNTQIQDKKLDNREKRFVKEYPLDMNPEKAAVRAGYSKTTAHSKAYQWVSNSKIKPHVYKATQEELVKMAERTDITIDKVLKEYAKLAFLDPRKFYNKDGSLIPIHKLPQEVAAALTGMDISYTKNEDGKVEAVKKIKYADKKAALDSIGKHLGMFIDKVEHGIDSQTLKLILSALPEEYTLKVLAELTKLQKG